MIEEDVSCDSTFMLRVMDDVGAKIRQKMWWVPMETEIDFILDNAGGHGTDKAKFEYMESLKARFNINIVWQVPQSPDTNILDLGMWCALQSAVEIQHRTKTKSNHQRKIQDQQPQQKMTRLPQNTRTASNQ